MAADREGMGALRETVGFWLKCWTIGQPQMGVDWKRPENQRYLKAADNLIEMIAAALPQGAGERPTPTVYCAEHDGQALVYCGTCMREGRGAGVRARRAELPPPPSWCEEHHAQPCTDTRCTPPADTPAQGE